ncbi:MAG TPA: glycine dehydrogenase, partial [Candidatus Omnitrophota bacterium]|nr:glycine dehydrogenase [Candidatus Omnitrophota bacterium]
AIYLTLLGKTGLKELSELNYDKAEFAKEVLSKVSGVTVKKSSPTFNEFTICLPRSADDVVHRMVEKGFAAGFPLGRFYKGLDNYLLIAVTEKRTREEILKFKDSLEAILCD